MRATLFSDPGCPWGYSAQPFFAALRWRYGEQIDWRLVMIGLTESGSVYEQRGYTPEGSAIGYRHFRRYGMPLSTAVKARMSGTSRGCRAIVAVRLATPGLEWEAYRALQFGWFCSAHVMDTDEGLRAALQRVERIDADSVLGALETPEVWEAYEADRAEARTAAGSPTEFQGKAAQSDGPVRYTAPSVIFEADDGRTLEAGGFQVTEAYDVVIANLAPALQRRAAPDDVGLALEAFGSGLTTAEVAELCVQGNGVADRPATEDRLISLVAAGRAQREALADGAVWRAA